MQRKMEKVVFEEMLLMIEKKRLSLRRILEKV
jgi:hypothetical protein